jgi:hypothetical protein
VKKLLLVAMAALVVTGLVPMASARADAPSDEASFVAQINALRAGKGLPTLDVDAGLTAKARAWAQTMANKGIIWHSVLSDGITADWHKLGENVGMGGTVDGLHTAFVNSPHHYENLVDPDFRSIGIGVVRGAGGILFVSEEFMQSTAPALTPAAPTATAAARKAPAVTYPAPKATAAAMKVPAAKVVKVVKKSVRGTAKIKPRRAASSRKRH